MIDPHAIWLLTTDQREHIEIYTDPLGDELPIGTRIRITSSLMKWCYNLTGTIEAYSQPPKGWAGWYFIRFDGEQYADHETIRLPKIHRTKFEVIE